MGYIEKGPAAGDSGVSRDSYSGKNDPQLNNQTQPPPQASAAWKVAAVETLLILRANFPNCFQRLDLPRRQPLKIGIHADIIAALPELSAVDVGRALKLYVGHASYLEQCAEGATRIGLDGQPAGVVTATEAEHATNLLAKRQRQKPQSAPTLAPQTPRLTLAALREAAAKRKREMSGA